MKKRASQQGFSLVELLVVLAVIAILGTLTVPAITSGLRGSALTQGALKVTNEFMVARQAALTKNLTVEVRFYQIAKAGMTGETAGNPATGKYRAMQTFVFDASGNATALDKVQWLPDTVIIDAGNALSTVIGSTTAKTWSATNPQDPQIALPVVGTAYNARAVQFLPSGATTLNPIGTQWFLTLHNVSFGDNLGALPKNFFILQLDALNGHVQNYRP